MCIASHYLFLPYSKKPIFLAAYEFYAGKTIFVLMLSNQPIDLTENSLLNIPIFKENRE